LVAAHTRGIGRGTISCIECLNSGDVHDAQIINR
jgi:hypothetical protein